MRYRRERIVDDESKAKFTKSGYELSISSVNIRLPCQRNHIPFKISSDRVIHATTTRLVLEKPTKKTTAYA